MQEYLEALCYELSTARFIEYLPLIQLEIELQPHDYFLPQLEVSFPFYADQILSIKNPCQDFQILRTFPISSSIN